MSVERETVTKLWCDMTNCLALLQWPTYLPQAYAEELARQKGWRKDKLGRHVCGAHPKLKGARRG